MKASAPYVLILCVGAGLPCYLAFHKWHMKRAGHELTEDDNVPLKQRMMGALVFVMYYLFPTTIIGLFKTFYCTEPIGQTFEDADMKRYFMTNLKITCFEGDHLFTVWVAVGLLLFYIFVVPGTIVYITKHHKEELYTRRYLLST